MSKLATNTQTTNRINSEILPELLRKINALPDAGSGDEAVIEALNITANGTYNATETVDGFAPITVNVPIPDGYIQPEGTKTITENGTYDVTEFASAVVEVPTGGGDDTLDKLIDGTLTEITSNATKISDYAFYYSRFITADFPKATSIGENAFRRCVNLTTANFPSVTLIEESAFYDCASLKTADFPKATSIGENAFRGCPYLTTANFPSVTLIEENAFYECSRLTTADFPSATSIGDGAFRSCTKLTTVDFPKATSIGNSAFRQCRSLTTLILRSETMATLGNTNPFYQCYHILGTVDSTYNPTGAKDGYFYVPRALLSDTDETKDYRRAKNWSTFETQFRALEDYTVDGTITGELDPSKI